MPSLNPTTVPDERWRRGRAHISGEVGTLDEVTLAYIDCPPPPSSKCKANIVLIHGFPQTSYQFRHVITPISDAGYRVIVPDYRGAGESSRPRLSFEKTDLAADIHELVHKHLEVEGPVHIVGHDIGGMVAHAYAITFPKDTATVTWGECPLPGSQIYENSKFSPATFHFSFHWQPDLPEMLTAGKEKQYIKHFFSRLGNNHAGISDADLEHYANMYSQAGALRCGFDTYRAFAKDAETNVRSLKENGKCKVHVLAMSGKESAPALRAVEQVEEMYENVQQEAVEGSGHWVAEENPEGFIKGVLGFVGKHGKNE